MNNLFEFVKALTIAHDFCEGLPIVNPDDESELVDQINPDDTGESLLEANKKSKCYKNPNFKGFKCDDCDCKEWN